jgi:amidase
VRDAALVLEFIKGRDASDHATLDIPNTALDYANAFKHPIKKKRLGLLRLKDYTYSQEEEKLLREIIEIYRPLGVDLQEIVFDVQDNPNYDSMLVEFKVSFEAYLESLGDATKMKTLADIVAFNQADPDVRMPFGQTILEDALALSEDLNDPAYHTKRENSVRAAQRFTDLYEEHRLDAMVSLHWLAYGPIVGHPSITVPAKVITDAQPRSVVFTATSWQEPLLIGLAYAYEQATHRFSPPPPLPLKA